MMDNYLTLVREKSTILDKILGLTEEYKFTGEREAAGQESEAFSELYGRRESLFERAKTLENVLKSTNLPTPLSGEDEIKIAELISEQNKIINHILEIDEANIKMYEIFKAHLSNDLKGVAQTKDLNERYFDDYEVSGNYFDKKN